MKRVTVAVDNVKQLAVSAFAVKIERILNYAK